MKNDRVEKKFKIGMVLLPLLFIGIIFAGYRHVKSSMDQLEEMQSELVYIEVGRIRLDEATHIPEGYTGITSDDVHVESAYLWAIPYVMADVIVGIIIYVKYRN